MFLLLSLMLFLTTPSDSVFDYAHVIVVRETEIDSIYTLRCMFFNSSALLVTAVVIDLDFPDTPPSYEPISFDSDHPFGRSCDKAPEIKLDARYRLSSVIFSTGQVTITDRYEEFLRNIQWLPWIVSH